MQPAWNIRSCSLLVALLLVVSVQLGTAQEQQEQEEEPTTSQQFGGPGSVQGQLADDARAALAFPGEAWFQAYQDWKEALLQNNGFSFTLDYTIGMLSATETLTEKDAGVGGAVRFFGSWDLVGRESGNTGTFIWKGENRHAITDIPASQVKSEVGYVGLVLPTLSDLGSRLTNLYWKQLLREGRLEIIAGMLDTTDWVDVYALASPWTGFFNFALATGSATIPVPDDATLRAYVIAMLSENV